MLALRPLSPDAFISNFLGFCPTACQAVKADDRLDRPRMSTGTEEPELTMERVIDSLLNSHRTGAPNPWCRENDRKLLLMLEHH